MVKLTAAAIALVPFPFSDLSKAKLRPALVLANAGRGDWVLCQITSNRYSDTNAIELQEKDFLVGSLHVVSYVRPAKLFTANNRLMVTEVGTLKPEKFKEIIAAVVNVFQNSLNSPQ